MNEQELEVGQKYQQIRGGKHIGEIVTILKISPTNVRYRVLGKSHKNEQQSMLPARFMVDFIRR